MQEYHVQTVDGEWVVVKEAALLKSLEESNLFRPLFDSQDCFCGATETDTEGGYLVCTACGRRRLVKTVPTQVGEKLTKSIDKVAMAERKMAKLQKAQKDNIKEKVQKTLALEKAKQDRVKFDKKFEVATELVVTLEEDLGDIEDSFDELSDELQDAETELEKALLGAIAKGE